MPEDVSDLKDVFDAINRLCETMKTSNYSEDDDAPRYVECSEGLVSPAEVEVRTVEIHQAVNWNVISPELDEENAVCGGSEDPKEWHDQRSQFVSAEDLSVQRMETQRQKWMDSQASLASSDVSVTREGFRADPWSDCLASPPAISDASVPREGLKANPWSDCPVSPPASSDVSVPQEGYRADPWSDCLASPPEDVEAVTSDTEPAAAQCEPVSDLYYTASSEVSLLSDTELPEKPPEDCPVQEDGKECVIAGHVAAMRERFESMTRANTPCPDTVRAASPALDVFHNASPSPDPLG